MEVKVEYTTPLGAASERSMVVGLKSEKVRRRKFDMMLNGATMARNSLATVTIVVGNVKFVGQLTVPTRLTETVAWWRTQEFFCQLHGTHELQANRRVFLAAKLHVNLTRCDRLDQIAAEEAARSPPVEEWFQVRKAVRYTPAELPPPYPVSQAPSEAQPVTEQSSEEEDPKTFRVVAGACGRQVTAATEAADWAQPDMTNRMRVMVQMVDRTVQHIDSTRAFLDDMKALKEVYEMY